ncbi:hypothetical protein [Caldilinea sp.]|uniref:hypothetical protein n=1 Tax=Caldilinea sp. TaxID=2293560 RepID=UPI0026107765|nr:hypothetical protein [Caldilinea sp.]
MATYLLCTGGAYTVSELATRLALTPRGTRLLLEKISTVVPVVDEHEDDRRGAVWRLIPEYDER